MTFYNSAPGDINFVRRAKNVEFNTAGLKNKTRRSFGTNSFKLFNRDVENPHDEVHDYAHCEMRDLLTASYDPIFWLHHNNIDRVFSFWQELNILRKNTIGNFPDMDKSMDPFHRSEYNNVKMTLDNSLAKEVFDYKTTFCYRYDTLTFDNLTPKEFLKEENKQADKPCALTPGRCSAQRIKHNRRTIVGVIMPNGIKSEFHTYEICHEKVCVPGGTVATFGYKEQKDTAKTVSKKTHRVMYDEITELVVSLKWTPFKISAHMTSNFVKDIPQPLVIIRQDVKEMIMLGPEMNREDYGDLIEVPAGDYGASLAKGGVFQVD